MPLATIRQFGSEMQNLAIKMSMSWPRPDKISTSVFTNGLWNSSAFSELIKTLSCQF